MKPAQIARLGLLALIWGSSYLFIKVAVAGMTPLTLVAGRVVSGALVLLATMLLLGLRPPSHRSMAIWLHLVVMAVVGTVIPFLLITWAEERVTSSLASILNATTPFFTLALATSAFRVERWSLARVAGLIVGFLGVVALTGSDLANLGSGSGQGVLALLLSSLCYGFTYAYARRFVRGEAQVLATMQITLSALILVPLALAFGDIGATSLNLARFSSWIVLGVLGTGAAYILYYRLIEEIGATRSSYATYLIPIVGVTWGWLLLDETIGLHTITGIALILAGLLIANGSLLRMGARLPGRASRTTPTAPRE